MVAAAAHSWLTRFAVLTAAATLGLICLGGLVTSHGAGLAVPDWPTTYGYNMFFFPFSKWVGGVRYEHTHRLAASLVGLLTVSLAVWIWLQDKRTWFRWLGLAAVIAVVLQGVLGGLRVTALKDELGIVHAALAQLFLALVCALALFSSAWWKTCRAREHRPCDDSNLRFAVVLTTSLIFLQLILGATMRHQHAGLAIPDFPAAYNQVWPDLDREAIARYNQNRVEERALNPITATQIVLQMVHRFLALIILAGVVWSARRAWRSFPARSMLRYATAVWAGLIFLQGLLGAATIWTNKSADIATAHVALGALGLAVGCTLALAAFRFLDRRTVPVPGSVFVRAEEIENGGRAGVSV